MKKQVLVIHGGETFETYREYLSFLRNYKLDFKMSQSKQKRWKNSLQDELGKDYQVILPQMPSPRNAKYLEWKIWLEKYFPYLKNNIILLGHSLGGIFLAKYLSENDFVVKIKQVHLIASPFADKEENSLESFNINKEKLKEKLRLWDNLFFYHSKDDPVVPFTDFQKYIEILPNAKKFVFQNRGHFITDNFPEILRNIKK